MNAKQLPSSIEDRPAPVGRPARTKLDVWSQFLGAIASGTPLQDAMWKWRMQRADIEACIRSNPEERARWDDARIAGVRSNWSQIELEDVIALIAAGQGIEEAARAVRPGCNPNRDFVALVVADPALSEMYMRAQRSRVLLLAEESLTVARDSSRDVLEGPRGPMPNNAAVQRSKLIVETILHLAGKWYPKIFADKPQTQVSVQILNYAERLEEARARATKRAATVPKITQEIVEAAFKDLTFGSEEELPQNASKEDWDDVAAAPAEPLDTKWLETD